MYANINIFQIFLNFFIFGAFLDLIKNFLWLVYFTQMNFNEL